ncbi:MAG: prepilin-type N-terminal cleavage/methylation domain-containing protein [Desulfurobacteriaceae bacterium]
MCKLKLGDTVYYEERKKGFTLVELLIVIVITILVVTIGFKALTEQEAKNSVFNAANEIKIAFVRAQSFAFKKGKAEVIFDVDKLQVVDQDGNILYELKYPNGISISPSLNKIIFNRSKLPSSNLSVVVKKGNYVCDVDLSLVSGKTSLECNW